MEGNVQRKDVLSSVLVFLDLKGKDARERNLRAIFSLVEIKENVGNDFKCKCPPEFGGKRCQVKSNN
ncbi:Hypothetical predicted protein, partial [Paramuricea clavata]